MKTTYREAIKMAMGHGVYIFKDNKEHYHGDYMVDETDGVSVEDYIGLFGIQADDTVYIYKVDEYTYKIFVKQK